MRYNLLFFLLLNTGVFNYAFSQIIITGTVVDRETQNPLSFVNIGIKNKNIGTSSQINGDFSIHIPEQYVNDSLTFSMVGYYDLTIPAKTILDTDLKIIKLKVKITELNTVSVSANKLVEKSFGIKNNFSAIHFTDGSTNQKDIFEIAQLIKIDSNLTRITSVNLLINESRSDSGTFRINFYSFENNRPGNRLVEKSIVQTHQIKEGWLKFDLTKYEIYLKGPFVVSIEFIPLQKENNPIYYEIKIGGSSKSFVRSSSQGEWSVPPHHYRLYITAMVNEFNSKSPPDLSEEKESSPTITLYSEIVKDSLSVFISLPKNYNKKTDQKFPVIYLLDANVYFDIIADAMKENKTNSILVGLGYKDFGVLDSLRNRDYTFPQASPQDSFAISGGADKFLDYIKNELVPFIDKNYRSDSGNRTLMGHSLGGYFTLYALAQSMNDSSATFNYYVAASPSIHYANNYIIERFRNIAGNHQTSRQNLFLTFGEKEDSDDRTGTTGMDNFNTLLQILHEVKFRKINTDSKVYPGFVHMETAIPTFTDALKSDK